MDGGRTVDVALVTSEADDRLAAYVATVDVPLRAALEERGARLHTPRWDDGDVDWAAFDVALVRTTWDYPGRRDEFVGWAARVGSATSLWNPADVLRWNTHKSYLIELEERGAPVVPTAWLAMGDRIDLTDLLATRGWPAAVVKPAVAAGAAGLRRFGGCGSVPSGDEVTAAQAHLDDLLATGDVMVQPYLDAVERDGEVSVVLVDGTVTHAVRKTPRPGDFRIHLHHGGRYERLRLDADGAEPAALARWIVEASGHDLLYARVDLLRDDNGAWQLAELELTEPDLYLTQAPEVGTVLADAVLARV